MSMMFAVCADAGKRASVVDAVLLETTESLAYGVVVAPMPTVSVVVASVTFPILFVVQPPPVDAPEIDIEPHDTLPELSVWSASEPVHDELCESVSVFEMRAFPVTSSVVAGELLPMPSLPFVLSKKSPDCDDACESVPSAEL